MEFFSEISSEVLIFSCKSWAKNADCNNLSRKSDLDWKQNADFTQGCGQTFRLEGLSKLVHAVQLFAVQMSISLSKRECVST